MTTPWTVRSAADVLIGAESRVQELDRLTDSWPELDLATAYQVQDETLARRVNRGERVVGIKLGLTSHAKQRRMGVDSPLTGWLTDAMTAVASHPLTVDGLIHPRAEPEIVLVLGEPLRGPGVTADRALAAVTAVHAGIEVIDSRYRDYMFRLPDVVADNASSGRTVTGDTAVAPAGLDLAGEECRLRLNGQVVHTATGAAVLGHPAQALALAANTLGERGVTLDPGWLVYTGGLSDAVAIRPGDRVDAEFEHLGTVSITVT